MDSAVVRKVALFENLRIYAYFQLPEAFRRLLRPLSGCLGIHHRKNITLKMSTVITHHTLEDLWTFFIGSSEYDDNGDVLELP
nr:hypothetical protein TEA_028824 [Ipomoea batatas]